MEISLTPFLHIFVAHWPAVVLHTMEQLVSILMVASSRIINSVEQQD